MPKHSPHSQSIATMNTPSYLAMIFIAYIELKIIHILLYFKYPRIHCCVVVKHFRNIFQKYRLKKLKNKSKLSSELVIIILNECNPKKTS